LVCVGDVNGDGEHDLAVYAPQTVWLGGIAILDGRTGSALRVIVGSDGHHHIGRTLRTLSDLDGDGLPELVMSGPDRRVRRISLTR
jgi:hypothetical protein